MQDVWAGMVIDNTWFPVLMMFAGALNIFLVSAILKTAHGEQASQSPAAQNVLERLMAKQKTAYLFMAVGLLWFLQDLYLRASI